ncbi:MAG: HAD-IA family hydrolase [Deltaproteobacteria bacterium]|nr:HAD-IA family hydrolase [Deltaproteobacteria bacterium]
MHKIALMVFDFDGTLVDSGKDLAAAVNHALAAVNAEILAPERVITYIGDGVRLLIKRSLGRNNADRFEDALDRFMTYYSEHMLDTTTLYPGVTEVLDHFAGVSRVVVTNKIEKFTIPMMKRLNIHHRFDEIVCMDSNSFSKPDPRLMSGLLRKYGIPGEHSAVVGDGTHDIQMAKSAHAWSCALTQGFTGRERLLEMNPDYCCDDIRDVMNIFY